MPSGEEADRRIIVGLIEKAYLLLTDHGNTSEEWPPGSLEALAEAVASAAELQAEYGEDATRRLAADIEALGEMRSELFALAVDQAGNDSAGD